MDGRLLTGIRLGEVRLVRCADVGAVRDRLRAWGEQETGGARVVLCNWTELPETAAVLEQAIDALARTALGLWPNWYGISLGAPGEEPPDRLPAGALPRGVWGPWLERAAACCRRGEVPRLPSLAGATQAAQLTLAIDPARLHLVLAQGAPHAEAGNLLGFARAAEWLARHTQARVVVLVPAELAEHAALDSISFEAVDAPLPAAPAAICEEKRALLVWPFHGNPHPDSPGEQALAAALARDAELAGLFRFNQPLQAVRGSLFTVDLVWEAGRVVVEVDGFGWHSGMEAFRQDRHRDYELVISGYLVLRLTHEEVMDDAVLAVEKIRDMVAFRRLQDSAKGEKP